MLVQNGRVTPSGRPGCRTTVNQYSTFLVRQLLCSRQCFIDSNSFRLLDLPRELRDEIYSHAMESSAQIRHSQLSVGHPLHTLALVNDHPLGHRNHTSSRLSYKVSVSCTLLTVSKRIYNEIYPLVERLRNTIQRLFACTLRWTSIESPSLEFLRYCPPLRLVFDSSCTYDRFMDIFTHHDSIKPLVRGMIFAKYCFGPPYMQLDRFERYPGSSARWQSWLAQIRGFPNLKTLGFEISYPQKQVNFSIHKLILVGTEFLRTRKIEVSYLFSRERQPLALGRIGRSEPTWNVTRDEVPTEDEELTVVLQKPQLLR